MLPFLERVGHVVVKDQNLVESLGYFINDMMSGSRGCPRDSGEEFRNVDLSDGVGRRSLTVHKVFRLL